MDRRTGGPAFFAHSTNYLIDVKAGVIDVARLRFRPILMISLAFMPGVFPLFISTGAGANARHAIGTGAIGGMNFATFFACC